MDLDFDRFCASTLNTIWTVKANKTSQYTATITFQVCCLHLWRWELRFLLRIYRLLIPTHISLQMCKAALPMSRRIWKSINGKSQNKIRYFVLLLLNCVLIEYVRWRKWPYSVACNHQWTAFATPGYSASKFRTSAAPCVPADTICIQELNRMQVHSTKKCNLKTRLKHIIHFESTYRKFNNGPEGTETSDLKAKSCQKHEHWNVKATKLKTMNSAWVYRKIDSGAMPITHQHDHKNSYARSTSWTDDLREADIEKGVTHRWYESASTSKELNTSANGRILMRKLLSLTRSSHDAWTTYS